MVSYMILYQVNPNKWWWGAPLEPLGLRYSMTAAVCMIVGMVVSSRRVPDAKVIIDDWVLLVFVFCGIVLVSSDFGIGQTEYTSILLDKMIKMAVFLACMVRMGSTRKNFRIVLWTLVIGTLMVGYDAYTASSDDFFDGRLNSVGGVDFRESSGLAAHLASMLPLVAVVFITTPKWRWKLVAIAAGGLCVNTIIQCRTRSAFVGLIAGAAVALILAPRGRRGRVYATLAVGACCAFSLTDSHFWDRMNTIVRHNHSSADSTVASRLELWTIATNMFVDHPLGVGVGRFSEESRFYDTGEFVHAFALPRRVTHNTYLLCATELGVEGLTALILLVGISLRKLKHCARLAPYSANPPETRLMIFGCTLSVVVYLAAAAFTDRLYTESFWWVLGLPVMLKNAVAREVEGMVALGPLTGGDISRDEDLAANCDDGAASASFA
jgi:O-antigen ligase